MNDDPSHSRASTEPAASATAPAQTLEADGKDDAKRWLGQVVADRYRITALIGTGGMGAVYRAEHVHMQTTVALKLLRRDVMQVPDIVARFEREAIAAAHIEHPNVVHARDFGRLPDGACYLVLDYVEGQMLSRVAGKTPMSAPRTLKIAGQIAEALVAAHSRGIVHRDLKPDNIMLVQGPRGSELVKVLDFGIAKLDHSYTRGDAQRLTAAGTVFGTPEYMSPEQAAGESVDQRADLYSLGLLMYRLLAGKPPFQSDEMQAVVMMQLTRPAEPLPAHVPENVAQLVFQLMAKDPAERPQSADEVLDAIISLLGDEPHRPRPAESRMRAHLGSTNTARPVALDMRSRAHSILTSLFTHRIKMGELLIPTWILSGLCGFALTLVVGVAISTNQSKAAPAVQALAAATEAVDSELQALLALSFVGNRNAVHQLEQRDDEIRSVREWLALARGRAKLGRQKAALNAYDSALQSDANVAQDPALRRDIWEATQTPGVAEHALRLAADHLGTHGADMLYAAWVGTKAVTPATQLAKKLVYQAQAQNQTSAALRFVLDWRAASDCGALRTLLPQASLVGDRRALALLKRAAKENECKLPTQTLSLAITAVQDRAASVPY